MSMQAIEAALREDRADDNDITTDSTYVFSNCFLSMFSIFQDLQTST